MTLEQRAKLLRENPDALTPAIDATDTRSDQTKFIEGLGAGGYSALNSILMGLPDFLVKTASGDIYKQLQALRKRNESASTLGDITGTLGSLLIPGGAIVKGLGAGAKAVGAVNAAEKLGKAADFLKGTELTGNLASKMGQGALRGAGQAAEQVVPRTLTGLGAADTDEQRQAIMGNLLPSIAVGGAGGAVLGPLANKLLGKTKIAGADVGASTPEFLASEAREILDKATLQQAGIESRALRKAALQAGFGNPRQAATKGGDYVNELAQGLRDRGIRGKKNFEAFIEKNKDDWNKIDQAFEQNAPKNWNKEFSNKLASDDDLLQLIDEQGSESATKAFTDIADKISKNPNLAAMKNTLSNIVKNGMNSNQADEMAKGFVANQIRKKLDDYVADMSGLDVSGVKADYKIIQPFIQQEARDVFKLPKMSGGSGTFEKAVMGSIVGGGANSGIGTEGGFDLGKTAQGLAGGAILGGAANKILPALMNIGGAEAGRVAGSLLSKPGTQKLITDVIQQAPNTAVKAAAVATQKAKPDENPEETTVIKEQALGPEKTEQAKAKFSQKFANTMNAKLTELYNEYYSDMSPDDFLKKVSEKTNNFQDMRQVAGILFQNPKEKDNFLRKYDAYLALKNVDIDKSIKGQNVIEGLIGSNKSAKESRELLVNTLMNLQTEGDVSKRTPAQKKILEEYLNNVKNNPQLMGQFLKDYGLDFSDLADMGLA